MPKVGRVVLSILFTSVLLAGQAMPIVNAAYATLYEVTYSQDLQADDNGHTYLYVPENDPAFYSASGLVHDSDMSYAEYQYYQDSWVRALHSMSGIGEQMDFIQASTITMADWLLDASIMPKFYDFANSTNSYDLGINDKQVYFGVPIGDEVSVILNPTVAYFGVFNVTTEEFFHLTATSRQDLTDMTIIIQDQMGRLMNYGYLENGDIHVIPFAPDGPGMYVIGIYATADNAGLPIVDLLLEVITPDDLLPGGIVEGVLPGSELVVKNDAGDTVHQEKAPSAHTFKFSSNYTHPGRLRYSMNFPELDDDVYDPFETELQITTDTTYTMTGGYAKYLSMPDPNGDTIYYQSFQNETYYLTIMGMEETTYTLLNEIPDVPLLPLSTPFYLESWNIGAQRFAYRLPLAADSLLKINTTNPSGFSWMIYRTFGDNIYRVAYPTDASSFHTAQPLYLPAGNYLVVGTAGGMDYNAVTQFTLGPVLDGVGGVAVDNGGIIGVRMPTDAMTFYRVNVTLETHDNVSVRADVDILNQYGIILRGTQPQLGNIQSGTGWVAYGANRSTVVMGLPPYYDMFCDGFGIIAISPYEVRNNTGFSLTNEFGAYTADYSVTVEDYLSGFINGTNIATVTSSPQWSNFTLGEPGDPFEWYMIDMSCEAGTWFNVTYLAEDIFSMGQIFIYQRHKGCVQMLDLDSSLVNTFSGDTSRAQFQFGSISDGLYIIFSIARDTGLEGSLDVMISPYLTNQYEYPPAPVYIASSPAGGIIPLAIDPLILFGGVGVVVVIVAVVLVKKRGAV